MKKKLLLFCVTLWSLSAWAFRVDNVNYTITNAATYQAGVTSGSYSGAITIPSSVVNPEDGKTYTVTSIQSSAFYGSGITSISIADSINSIGTNAFHSCAALLSVSFGSASTLHTIEQAAFYECTNLTSFSVPRFVTSIGFKAFAYCGFNTVTFDNQSPLTSLGNSAFWYCSNMTAITLPPRLKTIDDWAFHCCSNLRSLTIPPSVTYIGEAALSSCRSLSSISLPDSVNSVGRAAFSECSIKSVTIPRSLTNIAYNAFEYDTCLAAIYVLNPTPANITLGSTIFYSASSIFPTCKLYVPCGSKTLYAAASQWSSFSNIIDMCSKITTTSNTSTGGTTSGGGTYNTGSSVSLTATPSAGYSFINWTDTHKNIISTSANFTLILSQDTALIANFKADCGNYTITTPSITAGVGKTIQIPVKTTTINSSCGLISYQFILSYDSTKIQYQGYTLQNTLGSDGTIMINSSVPGRLPIAWARTSPLSGDSSLIILSFNLKTKGTSTPTIKDFHYNNDTIVNVSCGTIAAITYGDVDNNGIVNAYDAALVLQYSVGIDPLPNIDTMPWENWRRIAGDLDASGTISAYDASLILQQVTGTSESPSSKSSPLLKSSSMVTSSTAPDIIIQRKGNYLTFRSNGSVSGFNLYVNKNQSSLGTPEFLDSSLLTAININSGIYALGVAGAANLSSGNVFMQIPIQGSDSATFRMTINGMEKTLTIAPYSISDNSALSIDTKACKVYPNPVTDQLSIDMIDDTAEVIAGAIYTMEGVKVKSITASELASSVNVSSLLPGNYMLRLTTTNGKNLSGRFLKK